MSALSASPSATRSWFSWVTSAPVTPPSRVRQAGTRPYSSTTGLVRSVVYSTCPWVITCPADGSQVSVPLPCPRTVNDRAYPSVAASGVVADRSCLVTTAVADVGATRPVPAEADGENTPARHADTAPAASTTMPRAAARRFTVSPSPKEDGCPRAARAGIHGLWLGPPANAGRSHLG